jgi:hypothetical protein
MTPDLARGRRHVRAVAGGGVLLLLGPQLVSAALEHQWRGWSTSAVVAVAFLGLCRLLERGHPWPRPLLAASFWLAAVTWAIIFMMAGGPTMFAAPGPPSWAAVAGLVGGFAASVTLAALTGTRHLRAFVAAERDARRGSRAAGSGR